MAAGEFIWASEAEERLNKVPEGFMRNMTRKRVEEHAAAKGIKDISFDVVIEVIESSRAGMGSMMGGDMSNMPSHVKDMLAGKEKEDISYYFCFVCNFAVAKDIPEKCPICGSGPEKFSLLEPQFRTEAHTMTLIWSVNAKKYLDKIPDGFRRTMSKNEIEAFTRRNGYKAVTMDVVDERLELWGSISKKMKSEMEWDSEVKERILKIPEHIRGMVVKEMESFAKKKGEVIVSIEALNSIREKWMDSKEFHVKWQ